MIKRIFTEDELMEIIKATAVDGARHEFYDHTVKVAKKAYQYMTGDDQAEILASFKTKESKEQKEQTVRITNSVTQYVSNSVRSQFEEMARVDNVVELFKYQDDQSDAAKDKLKEIESRLEVFHANQNLNDYLHEAILHLNFYDPNAFVVVESRYADDDVNQMRKRWSYPLEIYSDQAVNYSMDNGVLQWLVVRHDITYPKKNGEGIVKAHKYTMYAAETNIVFQEIPNEADYEFSEKWDINNYPSGEGSDKIFAVRIYKTKISVNPAIRVGYIKDPATNRETCVNPLWPADKIYRDLIWTKSEYDLAKALHGFYQKFQYAFECDNHDPVTKSRCYKGSINGAKCGACKGTGLQIHTSVQDVIYLKMPNSKEKLIPLSDLIHYETIPTELIERNWKDIEVNEAKVMKAIFQRDLINKSEVTSTATEIRITENSKYNILSTYGRQWSRIWEHCVEVTAHYLGNEKGLEVSHEFSPDFVIETLSELLNQRKKAIEAQAPHTIIQNIDRKILMRQNRDSIDIVRKIEAKESWKPFREKSETERTMIVNSLPGDHPLRVRYEYFEEIFDEIFSETEPPFFEDMAWRGQKDIIDAIVNRIIEENADAYQRQNMMRNLLSIMEEEE